MDDSKDSQNESVGSSYIFASAVGDEGDSTKEQALLNSIKKLAMENQSVKAGLAKHNKLIGKYCDELESLRNQQMKQKEDTFHIIQKLKDENHLYKEQLRKFNLTKDGAQTDTIHEVVQNIQHYAGVFSSIVEKFKNSKSLIFPVQESQSSIQETQQCIQELQDNIEQLFTSMTNVSEMSLGVDLMALKAREDEMNQEIKDLKIQLSEQLRNNEEIHKLQEKIQNMDVHNAELVLERDKLNKLVTQLHQKIEQLEIEPSVEIMQVISPQQTKVIENLNEELAKTRDQVKALAEENDCLSQKVTTLNEIFQKMSQDASQHSLMEGKEISDIKETYETAIKGLKDEIDKQKQTCDELKKINSDLSENLEEQRKLQSADLEESANMRRTIDNLRKRESRDLDQLNQVTLQRDTYKKEFESRVNLIKELNGRIESLKAEPNAVSIENLSRENIAQNSLDQRPDLSEKIEALERQLSSGEQTVGILLEENNNLKIALKVKTDECSCQEMSKKIDSLVQENEDLHATLAEKNEALRDESIANEDKVKKLEEKVEQLQDEMNKLDEDFKQRRLKDSEIIQRLNEELITHNENRKAILREISIYQQAVEDAREKNDVLQATLEKSRNDFSKLWLNYETAMRQSKKSEQQIKELEELNKDGRLKQSKLEQYIDENYEKTKKMQQMLMNKDSEIEKLKSELQRIDIYQAQVDVYENDFKLERKAREDQHSDMLLLREEVHRLELENNRLRTEVEYGQAYKVQELQRKYTNSSPNVPYLYREGAGIYGRGGAPVADHGMGYNRSGGSIEVPPQEQDQVMQRACPKCHAHFPDLDSLQIHVLECVD